MSERQAKKVRKEMAENKVNARKKNPRKALSNVIVAAVVAAVAALGVYATWDKIAPSFTASTEQDTASGSQTIAEYAESIGTTAEELIEKCGMTELGLTADSDMSEMNSLFTIESYAKFSDKTAEELKAENGIEGLADDMSWTEASMQIPMSKVAEQSGMSFDEFAEQNGLPEGITADMTQEEAIEVMQEMYAAMTEETGDEESEESGESDEQKETEE